MTSLANEVARVMPEARLDYRVQCQVLGGTRKFVKMEVLGVVDQSDGVPQVIHREFFVDSVREDVCIVGEVSQEPTVFSILPGHLKGTILSWVKSKVNEGDTLRVQEIFLMEELVELDDADDGQRAIAVAERFSHSFEMLKAAKALYEDLPDCSGAQAKAVDRTYVEFFEYGFDWTPELFAERVEQHMKAGRP